MTDSGQIFEDIRQHMEAGGISPTPANYEFWYRYVTGSDPELRVAVDAVMQTVGRVSTRAMHNIRRELYGASMPSDLSTLIDQTQTQLKRMAHFVEETGGDAKDYSRTLRESSDSINAAADIDTQRALLADLVAATSAMIDKTERLEAQLAISGQEINILKQDLETARTESRTDPLTGLSNRKAFTSYLEAQAGRALADRKPLCVAFCDIDHFKQFNDTWGHRMGDEVLRLVGQSLEQLSHGVGYPARFGGEEFVIVLPGKTLQAAHDICEQIRDYISSRSVRAKNSNKEVGRITLSLGISQLRWNDTVDTLVERADMALYRAKATGRNRVVGEDELEAATAPKAAAHAA
ncbi:MAG: GGDEF domain-containing protein [Pseudomonadota bacterium]|jgi:diguanylate cyclase|nr:GGDEF domain-containing protein [Pseudomonadota bacterium]